MFVAAKRMGRPRKGAPGGKTPATSVRLERDLLERIDKAADAHGVGRTHEIRDRLELSFHMDNLQAVAREEQEKIKKAFGTRANWAACRLIAQFMKFVAKDTGRDWRTDPWAYGQFVEFMRLLLRRWTVEDGEWLEVLVVKPTSNRYPPEGMDNYAQHVLDDIFKELAAVRDREASVRALVKDNLGDLATRNIDFDPPAEWDDRDYERTDPREAFSPIDPAEADRLIAGDISATPKKSSRRRK